MVLILSKFFFSFQFSVFSYSIQGIRRFGSLADICACVTHAAASLLSSISHCRGIGSTNSVATEMRFITRSRRDRERRSSQHLGSRHRYFGDDLGGGCPTQFCRLPHLTASPILCQHQYCFMPLLARHCYCRVTLFPSLLHRWMRHCRSAISNGSGRAEWAFCFLCFLPSNGNGRSF